MKAKNIDAPTQPAVQEWSEVTALLDQGDFMSLDNTGPPRYTTWVTTLDADGSPHVSAVGAVWDGKTFWFQTADRTRKAKNLKRDPRCAISVGLVNADIVVEGTAKKVTDPADVQRITGIWHERGGWPVTPDAKGTGITAPFNAPGLGEPPWFIYRVTPTAASSVATEGQEARSTRWIF